MVSALLNGALKFFLFLIGTVSSFVFYPTQVALVAIFPDIGTWLVDLTKFFRDSVFPFLSFLKSFVLNVTCCPYELYMILIVSFFGFLTVAIFLRSIMLIWRLYLIVRGANPK